MRCCIAVCAVVVAFFCVGCARAQADPSPRVVREGRTLLLENGLLRREMVINDSGVATTGLKVAGCDLLASPGPELVLRFRFAQPNRAPRGMTIEQAGQYQDASQFDIGLQWVDPILLGSDRWAGHFGAVQVQVDRPDRQTTSLTLTAEARPTSPLAGVQVQIFYQMHTGHPAIRKFVRLTNGGRRWLVVDRMTLEPLQYAPAYAHRTALTPSERGAVSSVMAFSNPARTRGVIAVSEVPSALRRMDESGAMGYAESYFEWVLGPGETFTSEPVFLYGFDGRAWPTASAVSIPLDRTVEGPYRQYLEQVIGVVAASGPLYAPTWCTWSNLAYHIDDATLRRQADLAARCGFKMLLIDDGWQRDRFGTQPHPDKFPDFAATADYIRSRGLALGLWVSCIRTVDSPDLKHYPDGRSLPFRKRREGYCMSFASPWRRYYADDLVGLHRRYGAMFFKQDFTNVKFGDIAAGHESRTARESLLRGLRGLLESQDLIRRAAPQVLTQLSHEIYWGTPGVPCDVAMLKHAGTYHIPPNDYGGAGYRSQPFDPNWKLDPAKLRSQLLASCYNARRRFFEHRGLPAYVLEYYAAHTVNFKGSLTPTVQDRQVCSWLVGCPKVFAGDLRSLTGQNIAHYRRRFDLLERLQKQYDIYKHYQFSGVPGPTDEDWHWWGKLDRQGQGVVVVLRGSGGADRRKINVPWVLPDRHYRVWALLGGADLGTWRGEQLTDGALELHLPVMGQEILELKAVTPVQSSDRPCRAGS